MEYYKQLITAQNKTILELKEYIKKLEEELTNLKLEKVMDEPKKKKGE